MQKWEYLYIFRSRVCGIERKIAWGEAREWVNTIETATGKKDFPYGDISDALAKLGDEGWELVTVSPRASYVGGYNSIGSSDYAGFTDQEVWVFKRPKE